MKNPGYEPASCRPFERVTYCNSFVLVNEGIRNKSIRETAVENGCEKYSSLFELPLKQLQISA